MEQVSEDVLVVMDEAYYEFAKDVEGYPDVLSYDFNNVIVLRTFSKAYGLAGFRVGYAISTPELIQYMLKTKLTFEPGHLGQAAALAALGDKEFLESSRSMVAEGRKDLYSFFEEQGVEYIKSVSNFVVMVLPTEEEAIRITEEMLKKGVILRRINAFGLPNCIRVTVGVKEELDHFKRVFTEIKSH
jgi:histidinol-phosphate aminotransferase